MTHHPLAIDIHPDVTPFFDSVSNTISYIVQDPGTSSCAVIDSVLDFDYAAGRVGYDQANKLISYIQKQKLTLEWIIETHVHADHLSAAPYIQDILGGKIGISEKICVVQDTFGKIFNEGTQFERNGSQFDALFKDGDTYQVGNITAFAINTPGHTPACMVHVLGNSAFTGDTLFMPDSGSGRADFPGGDAGALYDSMRKVLSLPDELRLFICHDYGTGGREIAWETTVGEQRKNNVHIHDGVTREEFIKMRTEQDSALSMPKLIIPSLQVNMRAGQMPTDDSGNPRLTVPINGL